MTVMELEEQIRELSHFDKIQLIQSIAEMLKENEGDVLLREFVATSKASDSLYSGPIEAYEAASQLQAFLEQENG